MRAAALMWASGFSDPSLSWDDLSWLRSLTKLPLLLKGICHPDDVRRAIVGGIDGIYCSNHGGRQANGGVAAIDMLPAVVEAAGESRSSSTRASVAASTSSRRSRSGDGGRHRPPLRLRLAVGGEDGIVHLLRSLLAEADLLMAVDGYPTIADLTPDALRIN